MPASNVPALNLENYSVHASSLLAPRVAASKQPALNLAAVPADTLGIVKALKGLGLNVLARNMLASGTPQDVTVHYEGDRRAF